MLGFVVFRVLKLLVVIAFAWDNHSRDSLLISIAILREKARALGHRREPL